MSNPALTANNNAIFLTNTRFNQALTIVLGSLVIAISSQITIPLFPVPVILQTLALLTISGLFGANLGSKMVLLYLLKGMCGLPVLPISPMA